MTPSKPIKQTVSPLEKFARLGKRVAFDKGDMLIREGDLTDTVYLILSGRVKVVVSDADGNELRLATYGAGDFAGELAFGQKSRTASVEALESTHCAVMTRDTLRDSLASDPDLAIDLIELLINRTRATTKLARSLALDSVEERVFAFLNDLAVVQDGQRVVTEKITQQAIAHSVGCSRDMVSKVFKTLVSKRRISVSMEEIILL